MSEHETPDVAHLEREFPLTFAPSQTQVRALVVTQSLAGGTFVEEVSVISVAQAREMIEQLVGVFGRDCLPVEQAAAANKPKGK